jgi:predicted GTPase
MDPKHVLIMGAAGRDFHNFNTRYRQNSAYRVVAFTANQIPNIDGPCIRLNSQVRCIQKESLFTPETDLPRLIPECRVDHGGNQL